MYGPVPICGCGGDGLGGISVHPRLMIAASAAFAISGDGADVDERWALICTLNAQLDGMSIAVLTR